MSLSATQQVLIKILNLDEPLSETDQNQLLAQLKSAAEKLDHEIKDSRHRG